MSKQHLIPIAKQEKTGKIRPIPHLFHKMEKQSDLNEHM